MALALAIGASACGGTPNGGTAGSGPSVTVLMDTAPDTLDPGLGHTLQSTEATWLAYTGLLTYSHLEAAAGARLIPGVARSQPKVSRDGRTYTFRLRKGLVYSNGAPLKASDVAYAIERSIRLGWGGKRLLTEHIAGAEAFAQGRASSIGGIVANDASSTIGFRLTAPYAPFEDVLALPATAPVPSGTPMTPLSSKPPPGVGPYEIVEVVPGQSFSLVRNPRWAAHPIPGIPAGGVDIRARVVSSSRSAVEQVLTGSTDMLDSSNTVPLTLRARAERQAAGRFLPESIMADQLFFMNVKAKPFDSQLVRQAVMYAVDRSVLQRLDSDMLQPGCFLLPSLVVDRPFGNCPYGNDPNLAKARQLISRSGARGSSVTVWGPARAPQREFVDYYASVLDAIGLKASVKLVSSEQYASAVGDLHNDAQTGWLSFRADIASPSVFYQLLDAHSIRSRENGNLSQVDDPRIQRELAALVRVPSHAQSAERRWQALDEYTARKAYVFVIGSDNGIKLTSAGVDFNSTVWHVVYGTDWSLLRLK